MNPWKLKLVRRSPETLSSEEPVLANPAEVEPLTPPPPPPISSWSDDRQLSLFVLLALTAIAGFLTYIIFRPFLTALVVAIVMAIAFTPPHKWIVRKVRNTDLAALLTTLLAMLLVLVPFLLVSVRLAVEANSNYRSFLNQLGNTANWPAQLNPVIEQIAEQTGMPEAQLRAEINRRAREFGARLVTLAGSVAQRFAQQMMTLLLGSVFLFSLLRSSEEFRSGAETMLPLSSESGTGIGEHSEPRRRSKYLRHGGGWSGRGDTDRAWFLAAGRALTVGVGSHCERAFSAALRRRVAGMDPRVHFSGVARRLGERDLVGIVGFDCGVDGRWNCPLPSDKWTRENQFLVDHAFADGGTGSIRSDRIFRRPSRPGGICVADPYSSGGTC